MWLMSETMVWIPAYLIFLIILIRNKKEQSILLILAFALLIVFTDQIASGVFKPLIGRLRPTHDSELANLVHVVKSYRGGLHGFFSSHAANVFAFAGLSLLLVRNWAYSLTILLWASLISYSRVYLGVHFPLDILSGAVFGFLSSIGFYYLSMAFLRNKSHGASIKAKRHRRTHDRIPTMNAYMLVSTFCIILITCLLTSYYLTW